MSPPAGTHSSWFFPRTGFLWMPQSGVRSYRHISNIRLSGWNYPPLQALSNVRTDGLSDRSADWTEAPSDSTRSFSYALFSDGTPPRSFLSRSRTGTASNGGGFLLPVLFPGRQSDVHTGAPSDLLSHTPPPPADIMGIMSYPVLFFFNLQGFCRILDKISVLSSTVF